VRKTGRAIIAHEAVTQGGVGAELVASIQTAAFEDLVAPIERVGAPFAPIGASPELEDAFSPRAGDIVEAALRTMKRGD
jgi:pyruvate dehydrogenase E1 component beta subunit